MPRVEGSMQKEDPAAARGGQLMLFCFPMKEEAAPFRRLARDRPGARILLTGIGLKNAETSLRRAMAETRPGRVVTSGFAGGLNPRWPAGAVLYETDDAWFAEHLARAGATAARFHCADHIATTAAEKLQLHQSTGLDAVEMESAAIRAVCREQGIPCATVRVISDTARQDLPLDFNTLMTPGQQLDYLKLAGRLFRSPDRIGALLELQKRCRRAAISLATVLERIVPG
jgi:adenosylhomocysteine nucleosidase